MVVAAAAAVVEEVHSSLGLAEEEEGLVDYICQSHRWSVGSLEEVAAVHILQIHISISVYQNVYLITFLRIVVHDKQGKRERKSRPPCKRKKHALKAWVKNDLLTGNTVEKILVFHLGQLKGCETSSGKHGHHHGIRMGAEKVQESVLLF